MEEKSTQRQTPAIGIAVSLFSLIQGAMAVMAPTVFAALGVATPQSSAIYLLTLGIVSLTLGWLGLKGRPTAYFFISLLCILQSFAFRTPDSSFNFIGPISFRFSFGREPDLEFTINALAILFAACSAFALCKMIEQRAVPAGDPQ
ncbi:hypothetical protein ACS8MQ_13730 [Pseudomonas sp. MAHUQ-62]|uniref:hypothetical protein n=1 Tax=Pseudomonas sp. GCM10023245 TaxID=3252652 RepID=UPI003605ED18